MPGLAVDVVPGLAVEFVPGLAVDVVPGLAVEFVPGLTVNVVPGLAAVLIYATDWPAIYKATDWSNITMCHGLATYYRPRIGCFIMCYGFAAFIICNIL